MSKKRLVLLYAMMSAALARDIEIDSGVVKGHWSAKDEVWMYLGIPYAAPPTNKDRFQEPELPDNWDTFDAINDSISCISLEYNKRESEDCLVINVFVPKSEKKDTDKSDSFPVLFYIHGGGFINGSGNEYYPSQITKHGIILVTFNYRLGPLGFFCLGIEELSGNAGLKDQIAALKWVNRNIKCFGGNANNVTIYGTEAGATSVEHLMLVDVTNDLFHRAIMESGSAFTPSGISYNCLGVAQSLALKLGFITVDKLIPLAMLFKKPDLKKLYKFASLYSSHYIPCIEKDSEDEDRAITDSPWKVAQRNEYKKVPVLLVYADMEGLTVRHSFETNIPKMNKNFAQFLPIDLRFPNTSVQRQVSESIKEAYFGINVSTVTLEMAREYTQYFTDVSVFNAIYSSALYHSRNSNPVYLMEFSYRGGCSKPIEDFHDLKGAKTFDAMSYILKSKYFDSMTQEKDLVIRDQMSTMWANFIKYGNPIPSTTSLLSVNWTKFSSKHQNYLAMSDQMTEHVLSDELKKRLELWMDYYKKYLRHPSYYVLDIETEKQKQIIVEINNFLLFVCYLLKWFIY